MDKRPLCLLVLLAWGGSPLCAQDPALELPPALSAVPETKPAAKSPTPEKPAAVKAPSGPNVVTKAPGTSPAPVTVKTKRRTERVAFGERTPSSTVAPTPKPRRMSFFEFLFGPRKPKATPTPIPATPTPTPRPKKIRPKTTPAPDSAPGTINPAPTATPTPRSTPGKSNDTPMATPAKKISKPADPEAKATPAPKPLPKPLPTPPSGADADTQEKFHYNTARAKALDDPSIQKLKEKADTAGTDEEARTAQRAYNKALFNKIRSLDGSVKERADRIESSLMKRLDEQ